MGRDKWKPHWGCIPLPQRDTSLRYLGPQGREKQAEFDLML